MGGIGRCIKSNNCKDIKNFLYDEMVGMCEECEPHEIDQEEAEKIEKEESEKKEMEEEQEKQLWN